MFGYVTADRGELKVKEEALYKAYYCGLCKSLSERYGKMPAAFLTYDSVFLALLLDSLRPDEETIRREACSLHKIKRRPVVRDNAAVDYAADVMVLLAYQKAEDTARDGNRWRGKALTTILKPAYRRVKAKYPRLVAEAEEALSELCTLENSKSPSLDRVAACSGRVTGACFRAYPEGLDELTESGRRRILYRVGFDLGRWIYVQDAWEDYQKDKKAGVYNPLLYRKEGIEGIYPLLCAYLHQLHADIDLLEIRKNKGIIDNIVRLGLTAHTASSCQNLSGEKNLTVEKGREHAGSV